MTFAESPTPAAQSTTRSRSRVITTVRSRRGTPARSGILLISWPAASFTLRHRKRSAPPKVPSSRVTALPFVHPAIFMFAIGSFPLPSMRTPCSSGGGAAAAAASALAAAAAIACVAAAALSISEDEEDDDDDDDNDDDDCWSAGAGAGAALLLPLFMERDILDIFSRKLKPVMDGRIVAVPVAGCGATLAPSTAVVVGGGAAATAAAAAAAAAASGSSADGGAAVGSADVPSVDGRRSADGRR